MSQATQIHELITKVEGLQITIDKEFGKDHVHYNKVSEILLLITQTMQKADPDLIEHVFETNIIPKIMQLTHKVAQHQRLNRYGNAVKPKRARAFINENEVIAPAVALHKVMQNPERSALEEQTIQATLKHLHELLKAKTT